jgi:hypothetical protein
MREPLKKLNPSGWPRRGKGRYWGAFSFSVLTFLFLFKI